ncbi:MAG: WYL domain-containing protein [Anaerovorax sp.]|nr:WYL domain-containing protein [Anaerovorax sp.]
MIDKIKIIRMGISIHHLLEMDYYSGSGYYPRSIEPYKLIFKQENWYLFGYCKYKKDFRIFKVSRMTDLQISDETFDPRKDYIIPPLQSDFANDSGISITVRMDKSLEFLAVDFFGLESMTRVNNDIFITFQTERPEWLSVRLRALGIRRKLSHRILYVRI